VDLDVLGEATLGGIHIPAHIANVLELLLVADEYLMAALGFDSGMLPRQHLANRNALVGVDDDLRCGRIIVSSPDFQQICADG